MVKDLMHLVKKVESIPEDMPFLEFKKLFSETKQHYFPVTASNERFIGIFPSNDIRSVLFSAETEHLVVMKDIGTSKNHCHHPRRRSQLGFKKFTIKKHRQPSGRKG